MVLCWRLWYYSSHKRLSGKLFSEVGVWRNEIPTSLVVESIPDDPTSYVVGVEVVESIPDESF